MLAKKIQHLFTCPFNMFMKIHPYNAIQLLRLDHKKINKKKKIPSKKKEYPREMINLISFYRYLLA